MKAHPFRTYLLRVCVCAVPLLCHPPRANAQTAQADRAAPDPPSGTEQGFVSTYGQSPGWFPHLWRPYVPQSLPHPVLENSPRLATLIRNVKLELSVSDAVALTLENNLDIV